MINRKQVWQVFISASTDRHSQEGLEDKLQGAAFCHQVHTEMHYLIDVSRFRQAEDRAYE